MRISISILLVIFSFHCSFAQQMEKGWSVETQKKVVYFSETIKLIGEDSVQFVSDSLMKTIAIDHIDRITYHREGRSGWKGTLIGTIAGAAVGSSVFLNNTKNNDLEQSEKILSGTLTGFIGAVIGGTIGGFVYKRRTIEDNEVLIDLPYPKKQQLVNAILGRHKEF